MYVDYVRLHEDLQQENFQVSADVCAELMQHWLWGTDMKEKCTAHMALNESHVLGLLLSHAYERVGFAALCEWFSLRIADETTVVSRFVLSTKPVCEYTLRELGDALTNLQLQWKDSLYTRKSMLSVKDAVVLLFQCFVRFSVLSRTSHPASVLDDANSTCEDPTNVLVTGARRLSHVCIRRLTNLFQVLFRHLKLLSQCKTLESGASTDSSASASHIEPFVVEASIDKYYELCMINYVPPAARIIYIHEFSGMYNSLSQVVYFFDSQYKREPPADVEAIRTGRNIHHALACLLTLYPEIVLCFEDDCISFACTHACKRTKRPWTWIVLPGCIYLRDPEDNVYHCFDLFHLIDTVYTS